MEGESLEYETQVLLGRIVLAVICVVICVAAIMAAEWIECRKKNTKEY